LPTLGRIHHEVSAIAAALGARIASFQLPNLHATASGFRDHSAACFAVVRLLVRLAMLKNWALSLWRDGM